VQPPDLLTGARRLIQQGWTQHADARAADDTPVSPWNPTATSWSLLGALVASLEQLAAYLGEPAAISDLARACIKLSDILDADSLEQWNDAPGRTADEVIDALGSAGAFKADGHDDA
jgi:hypothetical protein